ncbi:putative peptidoglycan-binding lysin subgroup protein [Venturia nashicola]|uniref:Putative peptidoglycan-binding lysin subgroup protein n=1 Tax=Venturia nashicola TaxID=86259 RepID=A0A4Z1P918_9PEZI|nr:putative peptidoglycan-binding lysin subgroup protein [Venturia nashicola]
MLFAKLSAAVIPLFTLLVAAAPAPAPDFLAPGELCNGTITLDPTVQNYTVASGDSLLKIANKFNRGPCNIAIANKITNINFIEAGAVLIIPAQVCIPDYTSCLPKDPVYTATSILGGPGFYQVLSGDTLTNVAKLFQITLPSLIAANPLIANPDLILVGQIINVPVLPGSSCTITPYTIVKGDIFFDLAAKFGSTAGQLLALNTGTDPTKLAIGQSVTIARDCKSGTGGKGAPGSGENKYWKGHWGDN